LGLGFIAAVIGKIGVESEIIDCQVTKEYEAEILQALHKYSVVGITATIGSISSAIEIATLIRQDSPKTRIIFGGPHPTAVYEKLIPKYADIVVLGEGEDTITELMQEEDLSRIKGIAYWDGSLKVNERRPLIEDLDRLGFPAWHLFNLNKYRFIRAASPFASIMTSRGCPYQCIYCTKHVHGSKMRLRSVENVLSEIDYLVNSFGVKEIQIVDDNFAFSIERVKELCRLIIKRRYKNLRLTLSTGMRADCENDEMFHLLKQAGVYQIGFGIESGSQEVVNKIGKNLDLNIVRKSVAMAKKQGLEVRALFIIGLPFETKETLRETIKFAKSLKIDTVTFTMAMPFPGTSFYNLVKQEGRFLGDLEMDSASLYMGATYELDSLKADDMNKAQRNAYRQFYLRPSQFWRLLTTKIDSKMLPGLFNYTCDILFRAGQVDKK
jgi:radical SAM superfamily enzyme YgiQ (UPF0313 family)